MTMLRRLVLMMYKELVLKAFKLTNNEFDMLVESLEIAAHENYMSLTDAGDTEADLEIQEYNDELELLIKKIRGAK